MLNVTGHNPFLAQAPEPGVSLTLEEKGIQTFIESALKSPKLLTPNTLKDAAQRLSISLDHLKARCIGDKKVQKTAETHLKRLHTEIILLKQAGVESVKARLLEISACKKRISALTLRLNEIKDIRDDPSRREREQIRNRLRREQVIYKELASPHGIKRAYAQEVPRSRIKKLSREFKAISDLFRDTTPFHIPNIGPSKRNMIFFPEETHGSSVLFTDYDAPSAVQKLRFASLVITKSKALDPKAKWSILRKSTHKSNIATRAAMWIHSASRNHSIYTRKTYRTIESIPRMMGSLISEILLHINLCFDTIGYSSLDDVKARFLEKCNKGGLNKWALAPLEVLVRTLSTLISIGISLGIIATQGLMFILSKASALLIGGLIQGLTVTLKVPLFITAHLVFFSVIGAGFPFYWIFRGIRAIKEQKDLIQNTPEMADRLDKIVLGLSGSRSSGFSYRLNPLRTLKDKQNQTLLGDTFLFRAFRGSGIDYTTPEHRSPAEDFLIRASNDELYAACHKYNFWLSGSTARLNPVKALHFMRLTLSKALLDPACVDRDNRIILRNLLATDNQSLSALYQEYSKPSEMEAHGLKDDRIELLLSIMPLIRNSIEELNALDRKKAAEATQVAMSEWQSNPQFQKYCSKYVMPAAFQGTLTIPEGYNAWLRLSRFQRWKQSR